MISAQKTSLTLFSLERTESCAILMAVLWNWRFWFIPNWSLKGLNLYNVFVHYTMSSYNFWPIVFSEFLDAKYLLLYNGMSLPKRKTKFSFTFFLIFFRCPNCRKFWIRGVGITEIVLYNYILLYRKDFTK